VRLLAGYRFLSDEGYGAVDVQLGGESGCFACSIGACGRPFLVEGGFESVQGAGIEGDGQLWEPELAEAVLDDTLLVGRGVAELRPGVSRVAVEVHVDELGENLLGEIARQLAPDRRELHVGHLY
jgi:hypothetical protein